MRTFRDAKAMARSLSAALAERKIDLPHSACLEIVAAQFAVDNWNVLAAKIADAGDGTPPSEVAPAAGADFRRVIPILRIFSIEKATEFYVDFLGFKVDWEHRFGDNFPVYMQVSRGDLVLHLSEHHGDASPGSTVFVWMRGIATFHAELMAKDYRYNKPGLEDAVYDAKLVQVSDPFGNRIRFSEPNKADDPRA
jgi:catechol 2,3-dioxygenase-like lactoylglutathione lyase family enzyme